MSGAATKKMLKMYSDGAPPTLFLTKQFKEITIYNSESVEIDVERNDEEVAVNVVDISTGHNWNVADEFTNKEFVAPAYSEATALDSFKLSKRMPGRDPFEDPQFRADAIKRIQSAVLKVQAKIARAIEWQASQVLQTGTAVLVDAAGTTLFTIDYSPKATHFPDAAIVWDQETATPIADLASLMGVVRADGKREVDVALFGGLAWEAFVSHASVRNRLDTRRIDLGQIRPDILNGDGATRKGIVDIDNYKLECWGYDGRFKHPETGASSRYLTEAQVTVRASQGRLDATFGNIPNIGRELGVQRVDLIPSLPKRISLPGQGIDLHVNVWLSPDGVTLNVSVGARPLLIPVGIDTFGSINTGVPTEA